MRRLLRYALTLALVLLLGVLCYLLSPTEPEESRRLKMEARRRLDLQARIPDESNGYTMLAFIPRPGNPPERGAIYSLSLHHPSQETPVTTGLAQALTAFRRSRPLFDHALERPYLFFPEGSKEGITLAIWLTRAYLVDGANQPDEGGMMRVTCQAWRLGAQTLRNGTLPTLRAGMEMSWLAAEGLQPLVANGRLSAGDLQELARFLDANRLSPDLMVLAGDAEAARFEADVQRQPISGAGKALPGFLQGTFRQREVRVYDVCYLRIRPCLEDLESCAARGLNLPRSLALMVRNGDSMAAEEFPELDQLLLSYRFTLDRQDQLRAAIALQLAWTPEHGYPPLRSLGLKLTPRLQLTRDRLILDGSDYPGMGSDELELRLKSPVQPPPRPATAPAERASPGS